MNDPDFDRVAPGSALYLHVPFCSQICDFCNFVKKKPEAEDFRRFCEGVLREWHRLRFEGPVSSMFWGGGTPGLLRASDIRKIGGLFRSVLAADAEWTVELTPNCVTPLKVAALREIGVNRISMGVQSFQPKLLEAMGRPYNPDRVHRAMERLVAAGFPSINIDLIIAIPGQTEEDLLEDLDRAIALRPNHISTYCLTLEEDTALYTRLSRTGQRMSEEEEAHLYERAWQHLQENGFHQYEISNFCRPGSECQHHLNVWGMGNWRGVGPSAASQMEGVRYRNPHVIEACLRAQKEGISTMEEVVVTAPISRLGDRICFGLRRNSGVPLQWLEELPPRCRQNLECFFARLMDENLAHQPDGHLRLNLSGRLLADGIARECLSKINFSLHDGLGKIMLHSI